MKFLKQFYKPFEQRMSRWAAKISNHLYTNIFGEFLLHDIEEQKKILAYTLQSTKSFEKCEAQKALIEHKRFYGIILYSTKGPMT